MFKDFDVSQYIGKSNTSELMMLSPLISTLVILKITQVKIKTFPFATDVP